jgi:hypothetical protein
MKPKFKNGQQVILPKNDVEGFPYAEGTILEYEGNDLYMIEVDEEFLEGTHDDGLREVLEEFMVAK